MTDAQWLFEFHALRRVDEERQALFEAQGKLLIKLLGLDTFAVGENKFVPLALMCGNPEVLHKLAEEAEYERKALESAEDTDFDAWSAAMAAGEPDTDIWPDEPEPEVQMPRSPRLEFDDDD